MALEDHFLYDTREKSESRFVCFLTENRRFDLGIVHTEHFEGKYLVLDIQSNRYAIIGPDDLKEPGYLEHVFQLSEEDSDDLRHFLEQLF
ncbi:DUF3055 domain-containing protein [Massilibacterium senegalense]|uniref:DUF3055 domain-containing protein n=1 Tax=Massilibacterium senegalense TaxID=1632858 RepID=UPI00078104D8|nr:DUF3055 domain-containing protein [Massilibacterium senegalense]